MLPAVYFFVALVFVASLTPASGAEQAYYFTHRDVGTSSQEAQDQFDRGLTFYYAFNRQAAAAAFRKAAALDPTLALAWWGVALALGPNINIAMSKDDMTDAVQAINKAKALTSAANTEDTALIDALASRYRIGGDQRQLAIPYAKAMQKVAVAYPDDSDVQAVYLESILDMLELHGAVRGLPTWATMASTANADMNRWPAHIGILHYFIHLTEPDTTPIATQVANELAGISFAPQASHLTHMPSHVYVYIGQWVKVAALNRRAVQMDTAQAKEADIDPSHLDYFFHNLDFWYGGAVMSGNESSARDAVAARSKYSQDAQWVLETRFGATDKALSLIKETRASSRLDAMPAGVLLAYGIAMSHATENSAEQPVLRSLRSKKNSETNRLALMILQGRIAEATSNDAQASDLYNQAAKLQDSMDFEAAPPWYFYPRELLARMELRDGQAAAAARTAVLDRAPKR